MRAAAQFLSGTGRGTTEGGGGAPAGMHLAVPLHHPAGGPPPPMGEEQ
jgi:hypothetical protein